MENHQKTRLFHNHHDSRNQVASPHPRIINSMNYHTGVGGQKINNDYSSIITSVGLSLLIIFRTLGTR